MNEPQTYVDLQDAGNAQAQLILQAIARHADWATGECYPSQEALADMAKTTARNVRRYLVRLETDGFIKREERRKGSGAKMTDLIVLVGYREWYAVLRAGGSVAKPKEASRYEQPDKLSSGLPEDLSGAPGQLLSAPPGQQLSANKGTSLNVKGTEDARAREGSISDFGSEAKVATFQITKANNPDEIAAWRRYALHRQGHQWRIIVRHIDQHGFATVPSLMPPDETLTEKSKRMAGDAA